MKLETLARRIAQKTDTPELEKLLLEGGDIPTKCMPWTGATIRPAGGDFRLKMGRDYNNVAVPAMVMDRPYGKIRWQGKIMMVHRLVFQLIIKPDFEYYMRDQCGNSLCVNPMHWEIIPLSSNPPAPPPPEVIEETWTEQEVEEMLDYLLFKNEVKSWDDIISHEAMEGAPPEMLEAQLAKWWKAHLLPPGSTISLGR